MQNVSVIEFVLIASSKRYARAQGSVTLPRIGI